MDKDHRWRWLGVEFAVIVLGILSALFVDTWMDERQDMQRADIYRQRLIADLEADIRNLDDTVMYYGRIRSFGLSVLEDLEGKRPLDDFQLLFSAFNAAEEWGYRLASSTYLDMQNTGGLALFDDVQFRLDLANYHRQASARELVWNLPRAYREVARGIIPNALQQAIHEQCLNIPSDIQTSAAEARSAFHSAMGDLSDRCGLRAEDFDLAQAVATFRSHPEVEMLLRFRMSEARVSLKLFEGQREMATSLLSSLR
jgi:hypothetical protein